MNSNTEWIRLRMSIDTLVNRLDQYNIEIIAVELFKLNLYRAKGLLVQKLIYTQRKSPKPAWIYASLTNILNFKVPDIGKILVNRLVIIFKNEYMLNKRINLDFLCELVNYKVLNNLVVLQILELLMNNNTDDSIDLAVRIIKRNGSILPSNIVYLIIDKLRNLVNENLVNQHTKKSIEGLLVTRKRGFKDFTQILIDGEMCHDFDLDDDFHNYSELLVDDGNEHAEYEQLRQEILAELNEQPEEEEAVPEKEQQLDVVVDMSQAELISLQKTVYLTIMSSLSSDEAVHKLLKLGYKHDILLDIIVKSCIQEKTYSKYYGTICEILALKFPKYKAGLVSLFEKYYETIHQQELNGIRNLGKLYGYLVATKKLPVTLLKIIELSEESTNSSSRIFIKFLLKEIVEEWGTAGLREILLENSKELPGLFQIDGKYDDLIFAINFFTAIGLGMLTDDMRTELESRQRGRKRERRHSLSRSASSNSADSRSSRSYSRSSSGSYSRSGSNSRSPSRSISRNRSYSRSRSASR